MPVDPRGRAPSGDQPDASGPQEPGRSGDLGAEIASAGRGLVELVAANPRWSDRFDLSAAGFMRSFFGPILALPLHLFGFAMVERAMLDGKPTPPIDFGWVTLAHLFDMLAFPLLIALIARPLRIGGGYAAFVIVLNWAALFINALFAAAAPLALAGDGGVELFRLVYLVLLCAEVFLVWRTGRVLLSRDIAPVLLVVVLSVGVSAFADQAAAWVVSLA